MGSNTPVDVPALRLSIDRPGQETTGEWRPRDGADTEVVEGGEHFALLLAVGEVVVVLHRDERRELVVDSVVCKRDVQQLMRRKCKQSGHFA